MLKCVSLRIDQERGILTDNRPDQHNSIEI